MPSLKNFSDRKGQCFTSFFLPHPILTFNLYFNLQNKKGCNAYPSVANLNTLQLQFWKNVYFWPFSVKENKRIIDFHSNNWLFCYERSTEKSHNFLTLCSSLPLYFQGLILFQAASSNKRKLNGFWPVFSNEKYQMDCISAFVNCFPPNIEYQMHVLIVCIMNGRSREKIHWPTLRQDWMNYPNGLS